MLDICSCLGLRHARFLLLLNTYRWKFITNFYTVCFILYRSLGISRFTKCLPSEAWLVTDCCGIVCAVFTYFLIFYASFVVNRVMLASLDEYQNYKWIHGTLYNIMSFLAFSSHVRAMLSDPVSTTDIKHWTNLHCIINADPDCPRFATCSFVNSFPKYILSDFIEQKLGCARIFA